VKQEQQNTRPTDKNRLLQFLAETQYQKISSSDSGKKLNQHQNTQQICAEHIAMATCSKQMQK